MARCVEKKEYAIVESRVVEGWMYAIGIEKNSGFQIYKGFQVRPSNDRAPMTISMQYLEDTDEDVIEGLREV